MLRNAGLIRPSRLLATGNGSGQQRAPNAHESRWAHRKKKSKMRVRFPLELLGARHAEALAEEYCAKRNARLATERTAGYVESLRERGDELAA